MMRKFDKIEATFSLLLVLLTILDLSFSTAKASHSSTATLSTLLSPRQAAGVLIPILYEVALNKAETM